MAKKKPSTLKEETKVEEPLPTNNEDIPIKPAANNFDDMPIGGNKKPAAFDEQPIGGK